MAREDVPAGTQLTDEVINNLFEMKEFAKPAPANGVENVRDFAGKFVTKDLASGQFLPKTFVGGDPKAAAKPAPADGGSTGKEAGEVAEKPTELPPVYHDVTIHVGQRDDQAPLPTAAGRPDEVPGRGRLRRDAGQGRAEEGRAEAQGRAEGGPEDRRPGE